MMKLTCLTLLALTCAAQLNASQQETKEVKSLSNLTRELHTALETKNSETLLKLITQHGTLLFNIVGEGNANHVSFALEALEKAGKLKLIQTVRNYDNQTLLQIAERELNLEVLARLVLSPETRQTLIDDHAKIIKLLKAAAETIDKKQDSKQESKTS